MIPYFLGSTLSSHRLCIMLGSTRDWTFGFFVCILRSFS
ncbi:unnamed protein product [Rhodiola kirilowii]